MEPGLKVLFIAGKGRAGSTLLDSILGQVDGFQSMGEFFRFWDWGMFHGRACGCGAPVPGCEVWSEVVQRAFGDAPPSADEMAEVTRRVFSWKEVPRLLRYRRGRSRPWSDLGRYVEVTQRLFEGLAQQTGARVLVDSTKWPASPVALGLVLGTEVHVLHLVRDPRAVSFSWRRNKKWADRPGDEDMPTYNPAYSAVSWTARNLVAELVARRAQPGRYMRLRYEELIAQPKTSVEAIVRFVTGETPALDFIDGNRVELATTHTVGGNPDRLQQGARVLRPDDSWRAEQKAFDRAVTQLLTFPLARKYGYGSKDAT